MTDKEELRVEFNFLDTLGIILGICVIVCLAIIFVAAVKVSYLILFVPRG